MNNQEKLNKIATDIETCKVCKHDKSGKPVPGEGDSNANVMFLGEAPGRQEAESGRPFIGRSGQLLRSLIREAGLIEKDVYITSPVKYLPDYGTPKKTDIEHGKIHLSQQIDIINPKIIVLLGKTAGYAMLNRDIPILKEHGKIIKTRSRSYFITLHPAAAIRFQKFRSVIAKDFKKLKSALKELE